VNKLKVSKALLEVWEWKDQCYREVAHLPRRQALQTLMRNAEETARKLNLGLKPASPSSHMIVAESPTIYSVAKGKAKRVKSGKKE
jgi:hypothetical protein